MLICLSTNCLSQCPRSGTYIRRETFKTIESIGLNLEIRFVRNHQHLPYTLSCLRLLTCFWEWLPVLPHILCLLLPFFLTPGVAAFQLQTPCTEAKSNETFCIHLQGLEPRQGSRVLSSLMRLLAHFPHPLVPCPGSKNGTIPIKHPVLCQMQNDFPGT